MKGKGKPSYFLTAYGIARKHGFEGTEEEWLESLTAFWLAKQAGYEGTIEQWLRDLNDPIPAFAIGTVTTLPGGSNATVAISGSKRKPVLSFGIPRGLGMTDALPLIGGKMAGIIDMNSFRITNLADPVAETDAANKAFVEAVRAIANAAKTAAGNAQTTANSKCAMVTGVAVLPLSGWSGNSQRVAVSGVTADNAVIATPGPETFTAYIDANVRCTAQEAGYLTFACDELPETDVSANVLILTNGGNAQ